MTFSINDTSSDGTSTLDLMLHPKEVETYILSQLPPVVAAQLRVVWKADTGCCWVLFIKRETNDLVTVVRLKHRGLNSGISTMLILSDDTIARLCATV